MTARWEEVERRLRAVPVPPPPADLAERIVADIPGGDALAAGARSGVDGVYGVARLPWLAGGPERRRVVAVAAAAALAVALGVGLVTAAFLRGRTPERAGRSAPAVGPAPSVDVAPGGDADALLAAPETPAPLTTGTVVVHVDDPAGAGLRGIRLRVRGRKLAAPRDLVTDASGVARIDGLAPGSYTLEVRERGMETKGTRTLVVRPGETSVHVRLDLPPLVASITVESSRPLVQTTESSVSASVGWTVLSRRPAGAEDGGLYVDTAERRTSTFALDVDTASYGLVAAELDAGRLPPPQAVRVEEFLNSFDYGDPAPAREDFAVTSEVARTPFADGASFDVLRVNLRARGVDPRDRRPARLTFVVDTSGSMDASDRLGLVKRSLTMLVGSLRPVDRVALVAFADEARVVVSPTDDHRVLLDALEALEASNGTNAEAGLLLGYQVAAAAYEDGALNRVVLCSDGVANIGDTDGDPILEQIGTEARRGIEMSVVGVGGEAGGDELMEKLADRGNGRYVHLTSPVEARRFFVEGLVSTLQTVAEDARAQVEFDPNAVSRWRLIGYEDRLLPDESFRDDTVDAGEVGAAHAVTALFEVKLRPETRPGSRLATVDVRWRRADGDRTTLELRHDVFVDDPAAPWEKASPALRLATIVAAFAEALRDPHAVRGGLAHVLARTTPLAAERPADADVAELARLVARAHELAGQGPHPAGAGGAADDTTGSSEPVTP